LLAQEKDWRDPLLRPLRSRKRRIGAPRSFARFAPLPPLSPRSNLTQRSGRSTLQSYDASYNDLSKWPAQLDKCGNLTDLNLAGNFLDEIPDDAQNNAALMSVDISNNNFEEVPDVVGSWEVLEHFNADNNQISKFPADLQNWGNLRTLSFESNQMAELPDAFQSLVKLERLSFADNTVEKITPFCEKWESLLEFVADRNQLTALPMTMNKWHGLAYLSASRNMLKQVPTTIGQLFKLTKLHFQHNEITSLPGSLGMLMSVTEVDFSDNLIQEIPVEFFRMLKLETVRKRSERARKVATRERKRGRGSSSFSDFPKQLLTCAATPPPSPLPSNSDFAQVNFSENKILYIPMHIQKLEQMVELNLSRNELTDLPPEICTLSKSLVDVDLSNNGLSELPADFYYLMSLRKIGLASNRFEDMPAQIDLMKGLTSINMSNNPFGARYAKIRNRDTTIKIASAVEAIILKPPDASAEGVEKIVADIDNAKAGVKAYETQKATAVKEEDMDPMDSSVPPPPTTDHKHHFRQAIFQLRLGEKYFKSAERTKNGGLTDAEQAEKDRKAAAERAKKIAASLGGVMGSGEAKRQSQANVEIEGISKVEKGGETVGGAGSVSVGGQTEASDMSVMTKMRLADQEMSLKCAPMFRKAKESLAAAVETFNFCEELWIASRNGVGGYADLSTGVEIYYNRGRCYFLMEDYADSIKDLNKVVGITPNQVRAKQHTRGRARERSERKRRMIERRLVFASLAPVVTPQLPIASSCNLQELAATCYCELLQLSGARRRARASCTSSITC
jgi:Leucine-rich repeat (LRR) protein